MKSIQIRHVPEPLHRELKTRAALAGMSLSEYLLQELHLLASRPSVAQFRERLARRSRVTPSKTPVEVLREERDRR